MHTADHWRERAALRLAQAGATTCRVERTRRIQEAASYLELARLAPDGTPRRQPSATVIPFVSRRPRKAV